MKSNPANNSFSFQDIQRIFYNCFQHLSIIYFISTASLTHSHKHTFIHNQKLVFTHCPDHETYRYAEIIDLNFRID